MGVVLIIGAALLAACRESEAEHRQAAAVLVDAVRAARGAPHDDKDAPLRALRALECSGDLCEAHGLCVRAYELHQSALAGLAAARAAPGSGVFTAESVKLLEEAQADLEASVKLAGKCADAEGELVQRYGLE